MGFRWPTSISCTRMVVRGDSNINIISVILTFDAPLLISVFPLWKGKIGYSAEVCITSSSVFITGI